MRDSTRARVAAIVGAAEKKRGISSVYDYSSGRHRNASVEIRNGRFNGYDFSTSSHFSGGGNRSLDFFDYETSSHVQLKLDGSTFSGYDYHTGRHFSGAVAKGSISLYDYETGRYYNYSA